MNTDVSAPPPLSEQQAVSPQESAATTPPPRPSKRRVLWVVLGAALLVAGAVGVWWYIWSLSHEKTDDAQVDGHIHSIAAKVPGYVSTLAITDNQLVAHGEPLLCIRKDDYESGVKKAEGELAQAQADWQSSQHQLAVLQGTTVAAIAQAEAGVQQAQAQLATARSAADSAEHQLASVQATSAEAAASLQVAQHDLAHAKFEWDRVHALAQQGSAAPDEINTTQTNYDAAAARVTAAKQKLDATRADVEAAHDSLAAAQAAATAAEALVAVQQAKLEDARTGPDQVRQAEAQVKAAKAKVASAQAALELARLNMSYCTIYAPAAGVVSKRSVEVGDYLQPGVPVMAIVPLDDTWVVANFKETQLARMRAGQPANLEVDAYPDHPFRGVVDSLAAGTGARFSLFPPENATGNYVKIVQRVPVKIVLAPGERDPMRPLRPGMNVVVTVNTSPHASTGQPLRPPQPASAAPGTTNE